MTKTAEFLGFDVSSTQVVEVFGKIDPVPKGVYKAKVTSAERRVTKQCDDCWFWLLQFTIIAGEFAGRSLDFRFNIVNTNKQAEEIGRGQFRHYLNCIDNLSPQSEADLCDVPVMITVETRKGMFTGRDDKEIEGVTNEIVRIKPYKEITYKKPW
jgi:hypothetical protein